MLKRIVKALIYYEGKYLVLLRPLDTKRYPDTWDLPGGKINNGEDEIDGLIREITEETKLDVEITNLEFVFETDEIIGKIYKAKATSQNCQCRLSSEHAGCKWVTLDELKALAKREIILDNYLKTIS